MKSIIALDADGVLLNYHDQYRLAWEKAFGIVPSMKDANAYWPIDRWQVRKLEGSELAHFRSFFDENFWNSIPAIDGAVNACNLLVDAGYELICVSALEKKFQQSRLENLLHLGFPITKVIATQSENQISSPKAEVLHKLKPVAFIDDYLPYHHGIAKNIHKALILREPNGSPNIGLELNLIDSTHTNLEAFVKWWLKNLKCMGK